MKKSKDAFIMLFQYPLGLTLKFVDHSDDDKAGGITYRDSNDQDIVVEIVVDNKSSRDMIHNMIIHECVHTKQLVEQFIE